MPLLACQISRSFKDQRSVSSLLSITVAHSSPTKFDVGRFSPLCHRHKIQSLRCATPGGLSHHWQLSSGHSPPNILATTEDPHMTI